MDVTPLSGLPDTPRSCTGCGACCFSESLHHARVTGDDYERLGDEGTRFVTWEGNRAFMRLEPVAGRDDLHRCAALVIDPRAQDGLVFTCAVYERRPSVCRDLAQGGGACAGELATKAGRPKRALALLGRV